jgi:hypothetical protein
MHRDAIQLCGAKFNDRDTRPQSGQPYKDRRFIFEPKEARAPDFENRATSPPNFVGTEKRLLLAGRVKRYIWHRLDSICWGACALAAQAPPLFLQLLLVMLFGAGWWCPLGASWCV